MSSSGIKQENKKKKVKKGKGHFWHKKRGSEECDGGEERERERRKGVFRFSLRSTEIEPSVFIRAKRKVDPRIASYMWVPKSWSFVKLHEVGNFPTWNIFSLKVM